MIEPAARHPAPEEHVEDFLRGHVALEEGVQEQGRQGQECKEKGKEQEKGQKQAGQSRGLTWNPWLGSSYS